MENHYKLYQNGEINFSLQAPDNATIATVLVKLANSHYQAYFSDLRNHASKKPVLVYHGEDKQLAITSAYRVAKYFARTLDDKFEDHADIKHLFAEFAEDNGSAFIPYSKAEGQEECPNEGSDE